jgi:hypothetical protein
MSRDSMAIDSDGRPLPYTSADVDAIVQKALNEGDVLMAVLRMPSGDLAVQVLGPPSQELVEILETVAKSYRIAVEGH